MMKKSPFDCANRIWDICEIFVLCLFDYST